MLYFVSSESDRFNPMTFHMDTPTGVRLQMQQCLMDIDRARESEDDPQIARALAQSQEQLDLAVRMMRDREAMR